MTWPITYPDPGFHVDWPLDGPDTVDDALERFVRRSQEGRHCTCVLLLPLLDADQAHPIPLMSFSNGARVRTSVSYNGPLTSADLNHRQYEVDIHVAEWTRDESPQNSFHDGVWLTAPRERARWTAAVGDRSATVYGLEARWGGLCLRVYDPDGPPEHPDGGPAERLALMLLDPTATIDHKEVAA
jgi:hypothetical protein